jgi:hypothetical protein
MKYDGYRMLIRMQDRECHFQSETLKTSQMRKFVNASEGSSSLCSAGAHFRTSCAIADGGRLCLNSFRAHRT